MSKIQYWKQAIVDLFKTTHCDLSKHRVHTTKYDDLCM